MYLTTLSYPVKSEHLAEFLSWYGTSIKTTKRFSGCLDVEVHVEKSYDVQENTAKNHSGTTVRVLTLQTWADIDSHKTYLSYREATGYRSTYAKFISGSVDSTSFTKAKFPSDETEFFKYE